MAFTLEWHTPSEYVEAVRASMGGIDLDPASSAIAQQTVKAAEYYTSADDGLSRPWHGRVFLNPPYGRGVHPPFIEKLLAEIEVGRVTQAVLFGNNDTETRWFQSAARVSAAICFTRGRVRCINPEGQKANVTQGHVFMYFGPNRQAFAAAFRAYGSLCSAVGRH